MNAIVVNQEIGSDDRTDAKETVDGGTSCDSDCECICVTLITVNFPTNPHREKQSAMKLL